MRSVLIWIVAIFIFAGFYRVMEQKEALRRNGDRLFLQLAPQDAEPFLPGKTVVLNYQMEQKLRDKMFEASLSAPVSDTGAVVVHVDAQGVADFRRYADHQPLAPGEHLLRYRYRDGSFQLGTAHYFIPEGTGDSFTQAAYGELKVAPDGTSLLVGLRDKNLQPLCPVVP